MAVQMRLRRYWFECVGKRAYSTHAKALRSAKGVKRSQGDHAHPYKCGVCNRWHVGGADFQRHTTRPAFDAPNRDDLLDALGARMVVRIRLHAV
jgi:hypothetical protein